MVGALPGSGLPRAGTVPPGTGRRAAVDKVIYSLHGRFALWHKRRQMDYHARLLEGAQ